MDDTIFLARFWGSLFVCLGLMTVFAKLLRRIIKYTEERAITVSTGYITFLLGLVTVILHNIWVLNWTVTITILGWVTLFKGITKIGFPEHVNKSAQKFKAQQTLWGAVILLMGVWFLWMSFV
jgi:uncharacterized membrane protein